MITIAMSSKGAEGRLATGKKAVVAIIGPTAVGKTEVSLRIAEKVQGEIISADSRLFYRGMDIGTAKPLAQDRRKIPHHLIDIADPDEAWDLARFRRAALDAIQDIHSRSRLPLLVGGTGQYVTALLEGWQPPPRPPDRSIRKRWETYAEKYGPKALHDRLREVDPESAERIHEANVRRVIRALEITELTGIPASQQREKEKPPFRSLRVGLIRPRDELYKRIDERIERMIVAGLEDEVRGLLERGYSADLPALSAIGYKQMAEVVRGEKSLDEAKAEMRKLTRQFVRRQANWFKPEDPAIHWYRVREGVETSIIDFIRQWVGESAINQST
jgi:tRNA dimethylallyltransferase